MMVPLCTPLQLADHQGVGGGGEGGAHGAPVPISIPANDCSISFTLQHDAFPTPAQTAEGT